MDERIVSQQEKDRKQILYYLKQKTIRWTPIGEVHKLLEGKKINQSQVIDAVRNSRHFTKAWGPGGKVLLVSNCVQISDFVNIESDRETAA
jgi:hypothetical protein